MTPIIIAGPCSAESEAQVIETAVQLRVCGVKNFRAGLWKPRTRPGSFEGVGEAGIPWLIRVREETGMRVCTEVASAAHARVCVDHGIDMVWLGARTTTNPFLVQEIAEALRGTGVTVLIKNPVSPDEGLWAGAIERMRDCGIMDIMAVHRGFTSFEPIKYRNAPQWQTVIHMRGRFPDIPFLCDPSHLSGDKSFIREIAQRSLDLGMDGLMVECHIRPELALSDSAQQLTPAEFGGLMESLEYRDSTRAEDALAALRAQIDDIDEQIVSLLASRMEVSSKIGGLKKSAGVPILQLARWNEVLKKVKSDAESHNLSPEFVEAVFDLIHEQSVGKQ